MLKLNRIEKLEEDFVLVAHPFPQMEGEMLLFQIIPDDQEDRETILYNDFSLRKRIKTVAKPARMSAAEKKQQMEDDEIKTNLQCLSIDLENALSSIDWSNLANVIEEISGLAWF